MWIKRVNSCNSGLYIRKNCARNMLMKYFCPWRNNVSFSYYNIALNKYLFQLYDRTSSSVDGLVYGKGRTQILCPVLANFYKLKDFKRNGNLFGPQIFFFRTKKMFLSNFSEAIVLRTGSLDCKIRIYQYFRFWYKAFSPPPLFLLSPMKHMQFQNQLRYLNCRLGNFFLIQ